MSLIRVSRGIPKYNIQIGPQKDALKYNPTAILSVTDDFGWSLMQHPMFKWLPINEISKSWGYLPFYATKKILDFWCLEMRYPVVYLCCSAGKHRSPMMAFCWLLSQPGATPESVEQEFLATSNGTTRPLTKCISAMSNTATYQQISRHSTRRCVKIRVEVIGRSQGMLLTSASLTLKTDR